MKTLLIIVISVLIIACANTIPVNSQRFSAGKRLSFQQDKGNCLACHIIEEGEDPGNIGPTLNNITTKYQTKEQLKAVIWDATQFNAQSSMPPFGRNQILSPDELDLVVDYIWSLN